LKDALVMLVFSLVATLDVVAIFSVYEQTVTYIVKKKENQNMKISALFENETQTHADQHPRKHIPMPMSS
jgi:hypothetical protein